MLNSKQSEHTWLQNPQSLRQNKIQERREVGEIEEELQKREGEILNLRQNINIPHYMGWRPNNISFSLFSRAVTDSNLDQSELGKDSMSI